MVVMLAAIVGLQTVSLGYSAGLDMGQDTITYALHTFFALYILVLAVISLPQTSRGPHSQTVVHISCLSVLASLSLGVTAIIPRTQLHTALFAPAEDNSTLRSIWYSIFALYIGVCANALTAPLGPALHFPKELIYSEKIVAAITNQAYDNVSGITGSCYASLRATFDVLTHYAQVPPCGIYSFSPTLRRSSCSATPPSLSTLAISPLCRRTCVRQISSRKCVR